MLALARSIIDTEELPILAVNTRCPFSSNAIIRTREVKAISCPTGTSSTSKIASGTTSFENTSSDTSKGPAPISTSCIVFICAGIVLGVGLLPVISIINPASFAKGQSCSEVHSVYIPELGPWKLICCPGISIVQSVSSLLHTNQSLLIKRGGIGGGDGGV